MPGSYKQTQFKGLFKVMYRSEFGVVGAGSILRCGVLSFLTYFVPIALLRRKLRDGHHFRSAVAFGVFGAAYRTVRVVISRVYSQVFHDKFLCFCFLVCL
jgi:hypothetical protein